MKRVLLACLLLSAGAVGAHAQSGVSLGTPNYGGTGCPQGTANAVISPDGSTLSILYDQYVADTGDGTTFARKSCDLAIPVHVPGGYSVSILGIDYRGFNYLPSGTSSTFRVEYFFAGGTGPVFQRTFNGSVNDDYLIHNDIGVGAAVWSACGTDVNLRTNSSIRVSAPGGQQAEVTVDSEDVSAALVFHLQWRRC